MDFFNKLGDKIQDVSKEATKKAKDLSGQVTVNSQMKEHENQLNQLYTTLGKAYYEGFQEEADSRFQEYTSQIKILLGNIEEDKLKLRELKGLQLCANCGAEVDKNATHCPQCGTQLREPSPVEAAPQTTFCPGCGEPVTPGSKFCGKCGAKLN